ncbi:MAG: SprB repeat-containing protein, partial [Bacteroidia bacterium]|nr:SprB repeat-containing protein [Bacteroidia bacterium]
TVRDTNNCIARDTITITQPTTLSATASVVNNVTCQGGSNGSATVNPTGGTPPYSFSWNSTPTQTSQTATNLPAGTYTVTVTDANLCQTTASVTITQPSSIVASVSVVQNVSCYGGTNGILSASATGGTGSISYSWNTTPVQTGNQATNLPAGTYTVTATDANGCFVTASATISQPLQLASTTVVTQPISCFGSNNGILTANPTGGTPPYSYSWNTTPVQTTPTISNIGPGTYTVTVNDANGCLEDKSISVIQPTQLTGSLNVVNNLCFGFANGMIGTNISGGTPPYSYSWSNGQTTPNLSNLTANTYTVTVTDSRGCTISLSGTVTQPTDLVVSAFITDSINCFGQTGSIGTSATGGTPPYSYSWNTTPVQTTPSLINVPFGGYAVTVTDANGCSKIASTFLPTPSALNVSVGQIQVTCNGANDGKAFVILPNPLNGTPPYTYAWSTNPVQTGDTAYGLSGGMIRLTTTDANGCVTHDSINVVEPLPLTTTDSVIVPILCYGGRGRLRTYPLGGTPQYTFLWNTNPPQTTPIAINVPAGTYTCIVTDNKGCQTSASITLTQPDSLITDASIRNIIRCFGGTGVLQTVTQGGTLPYRYSWNTTPPQLTDTAV